MFKLSNADSSGTSRRGALDVVPTAVVAVFGQAGECDSYKVSGEWVFEDAAGNVVTLYDWKSTRLYATGLPVPDTFWQLTHPVPLHIGAKSAPVAEAFRRWLQEQLQDPFAAARANNTAKAKRLAAERQAENSNILREYRIKG